MQECAAPPDAEGAILATLATESEFVSFRTTLEEEAGVELLLTKSAPGSAMDPNAPGFDPNDTTTWQAHDPLPRGNAVLMHRMYRCHCHGTSSVTPPTLEPGASIQDQFLAKADAAKDKGRCAAWPCGLRQPVPAPCLPLAGHLRVRLLPRAPPCCCLRLPATSYSPTLARRRLRPAFAGLFPTRFLPAAHPSH